MCVVFFRSFFLRSRTTVQLEISLRFSRLVPFLKAFFTSSCLHREEEREVTF